MLLLVVATILWATRSNVTACGSYNTVGYYACGSYNTVGY